ncbi:hypothetical protein ABVT39_013680 [Epinephelus coioides]
MLLDTTYLTVKSQFRLSKTKSDSFFNIHGDNDKGTDLEINQREIRRNPQADKDPTTQYLPEKKQHSQPGQG